MGAGRPTDYNDNIAALICAEIASSSKSIKKICEQEGMPSHVTVLSWLRKHKDFLTQYTLAKQEQADLLAEEMLEIADDGSRDDTPFTGGNHVQRDRLKVETRKWIASKLKPKKYGDKLEQEHTGNIQGGLSPEQFSQLLAIAAANGNTSPSQG